jgi:type I restriction enzyme S subunit
MRRYAKYKDSGVEWIGEIPLEWEKIKLKYSILKVITGGTPDTSNDEYWADEDLGINWISITDITSNGKEILNTKKSISSKGLEFKKLEILPIGTLIYSIYGSIGKVSRLGIPSTIHQGILGIHTKNNLNSFFLEYYLVYFKKYVSLFSSSNTQENLNQEKVLNFELPLPPLKEQEQIVAYLDEKANIIDKSISIEERRIGLLKEYRQSIISEVVTGKIKVSADE